MNKSRVTPPWYIRRSIFVVGLHLAAFSVAYWIAFALKFDFSLSPEQLGYFSLTLPGVLIIKSLIFYALGQYRLSWRSVTFSDLASLLKAATISCFVIATLYFLMGRHVDLSRRIPFYDWVLTILILGGLRAFYRLTREEFRFSFSRNNARKALIVGANQSGHTLARHLYCEQHPKYLVLGFLDEDVTKHGSMIGGFPVLGAPDRAPQIAVRLDVKELLVISGTLTGKQLTKLMENCAAVEVALKVIPAFEDLLTGDYSFQIRDVDINDLLRREPVQLSSDEIGVLLADRTVLVTGAGGSIGSEICRQVLRFRPKRLVLIERAENNLFLIEQEIRRSKNETELFPCIADITDGPRIDQILACHRPDVVFHAAAHKHVPMMEENPGEAIKNNILGTKQLVELADRHGVQEFVMISTDKAVNPTSVMGVSKQVAERYVHAFSEVATTKFVVVRFGNVLASTGSVVPIFQEQIRLGGPITVTHPEIERFFMTIPEASQLVLQAAAMGKGGEIYVLDMGESVRIVDLAQDLVRLSGLDPDDIEIVFTGLRPGEKLYEELYFDDEEMLPTPHPKLFVAYHRPYHLDEVNQMIEALRPVVHEPPEIICRRLRELIPEYVPPNRQLPGADDTVRDIPLEKDVSVSNNGHADLPVTNGHSAEIGQRAGDNALASVKSTTFEIQGRPIGPGHPCLIVAEVAQAHDGSLGAAHAYIDAVANAGVDAVKFQTHIAAAESTPAEQFRVRFSQQDATRFDYWKRMEFTPVQWRGLADHARDRRLIFLSTPFSFAAVELLESLDVPAWKIGSGELTNLPFIERLAAAGRPIIYSSGMASWDQLDAAVGLSRSANSPFAILQCTTAYPCPPAKIGLNVLAELRERYACPVGLSDHSGTIYPGLAAATLGASLLEVHVVLSRECFGPDVSASVTTAELKQLVDGVRFIETALGHPLDKDASAAELAEVRTLFGKSIVAVRDLSVGHCLGAADLALKKPGTGIPPARLNDLIGRQLKVAIAADTLIAESHLD